MTHSGNRPVGAFSTGHAENAGPLRRATFVPQRKEFQRITADGLVPGKRV